MRSSDERTGGHVLVVSPSFVLRNTHASALEDDGHLTVDAADADEVLWCLVAGSTGERPRIDVIVADVATPGVQGLLSEVLHSPRAPALVLFGCSRSVALDPRLADVDLIPDGRRIDEVRRAIDRAFAARVQLAGPPPRRALLALAGADRREGAARALEAQGVSVVEVEDGVAMLEALGRAAFGWVPDVIVMDARLPRLDGVDALAEVRALDLRVPAVLVVAEDDLDALARSVGLEAEVVEARPGPDKPAGPLGDRLAARVKGPRAS